MGNSAKYYIEKYKLLKCVDLETNDTTYQRRFRTKTKNIQFILTENVDNPQVCSLAKFTFNKKIGDFEQPKFIENIPNDLKEITKWKNYII